MLEIHIKCFQGMHQWDGSDRLSSAISRQQIMLAAAMRHGRHVVKEA